MKNARFTVLFSLILCAAGLMAQAPTGYYSSADGHKAAALKTALCNIICDHTNIGYNGLWDAYHSTDVHPDGYIWDMYSSVTRYVPGGSAQGKNYSKEGDSYNREHSVPQSWFNEASPMKADIFHVYPTDGYVNNRRSNYPFGEVKNATYASINNFCRLGSCATEGYSGTVFEPADEYKGDFARTYFYMATCYENQISNWGGEVYGRGKYPGMAEWCVKMFLRWAKEDPVSQKEIDRNNAAYKLQRNRNPYIDFPGLEQYVWGSYSTHTFSSTNYVAPEEGMIIPPDTIPTDTIPTPPIDPDTTDVLTPAEGEYVLVTSESQLVVGAPLLIVCGDHETALSAQSSDIRSYVNIQVKDKTIETKVGTPDMPYALTLGRSQKGYTLFDAVEKGYLALTASANKLHMMETLDSDDALWNISINSDGNATIRNAARNNYWIQYNSNAPRFACYKSEQTPVQIYQGKVSDNPGINGIGTVLAPIDNTIYYDLQGRPNPRNLRGIHINNGKKYIR